MGWVSGKSSVGAVVFMVFVSVWVYFLFSRRGCLCYELLDLELCKSGIVACSVGDECEGRRGTNFLL
jgi:hypothetical protein